MALRAQVALGPLDVVGAPLALIVGDPGHLLL